MLSSPHQSPTLPPQKDSDTHLAQVVDLTLEQQVLLVSLEGDPQLDLQLGPREPAEVKEVIEVIEVKEFKEATVKDNAKPKSRAGSIGARSKDALSAISKRFSPPPSRSQSQSNSSPSTPAPAGTSQYSNTSGSVGSTDDNGSVFHSSLKQTGSLSGSPFKDHTRHHTDSATIIPQQHNRRSRSSFTSSCSASSSSSSASTASSPSSSVFFSPTAFYTSLFSPKHSTSSHSHSHSHSQGQCNSINPLSPTSSSNCFSSLTTTTTTTGGTLRSTPPTSGTMMAHRASFAEPGSRSFLAPDNTSTNEMGSPITRQTRSASCTRLFPMSSPSFSSLAMMSPLSSGGTPTSETLSIPGAGNHPGFETCPIEEHQAPLLAPGLYPSQAPITAIAANPDSPSPSPSSSSSSCSSLSLPLSSAATKSTGTATMPPTIATGTTAVSIMGVSSPALHSHSAHTAALSSHGTASSTGGAMATCQPHPHAHAHSHHPFAHPHGASGLSFESSVQGLELSLPGKASSALPIANSSRSLMPPASPLSSSFNSDSGFPSGSRRSSKDSVSDSVPGVTLDVLVDQLTIPDYINTFGKSDCLSCPFPMHFATPSTYMLLVYYYHYQHTTTHH
ncbi:MAG: hypothetical protein JOS17DRAFT_726286 [Linnemannia elongata]|nr:MAG: hypothetical protein JOS17DRAFT_726286 [Linnemannia elongata]